MRRVTLRSVLVAAAATMALVIPQSTAAASASPVNDFRGLTGQQQANLVKIARDTWKFYSADVDPNTHLPWTI